MKSVLISIQPKWCELIASGKKTIEVRKTRPKIETPFKCYIYETKGKQKLLEVMKDGAPLYGDTYHGDPVFIKGSSAGSAKVIGEFVCDKIESLYVYSEGGSSFYWQGFEKSCLTKQECEKYIGYGKTGYGWHISDLKIYDKPKELGEFRKNCPATNPNSCLGCKYHKYEHLYPVCDDKVTHPPQSWCYVEEI